MKCIRSEIIGFGHYLPEKVLTNDDLSKMVETNDEWISTRTGIRSRHISEDLTTAQMSAEASKKALADALKKQEKTDSVNADPAEAFAKKMADAWKNQ